MKNKAESIAAIRKPLDVGQFKPLILESSFLLMIALLRWMSYRLIGIFPARNSLHGRPALFALPADDYSS
jgi:hypothetical protein